MFFRPGEINGYRADRPCYVAISKNKEKGLLSVYEPSWQDCRLRLKFPFNIAKDSLPENVQLRDGELLIEAKKGQPIELGLSMD